MSMHDRRVVRDYNHTTLPSALPKSIQCILPYRTLRSCSLMIVHIGDENTHQLKKATREEVLTLWCKLER